MRPFAAAVSARRASWIASAALLVLVALRRGPASADPMSTSPEQAYDLGEVPNRARRGDGGGPQCARRVDGGALPQPGQHGAGARLSPRGAGGVLAGGQAPDVRSGHRRLGAEQRAHRRRPRGHVVRVRPERHSPRRGPTSGPPSRVPLGDHLSLGRDRSLAARQPGPRSRAPSGPATRRTAQTARSSTP